MSEPAEMPSDYQPTEDPFSAAEPSAEATITALEAEVALMKERWMRAEADMQNLRTRTQRDVTDARQYAIQKFAGDVVEAAQNLRRGLDLLPPKTAGDDALLTKLREGFEGVERSFLGVLERNGIVSQDPQGKPFDPEHHQAMAEQPAPDGVAPGTVLQAWTPTWTLHGRLLKPAMVVVAAGGAPGHAGAAGGAQGHAGAAGGAAKPPGSGSNDA